MACPIYHDVIVNICLGDRGYFKRKLIKSRCCCPYFSEYCILLNISMATEPNGNGKSTSEREMGRIGAQVEADIRFTPPHIPFATLAQLQDVAGQIEVNQHAQHIDNCRNEGCRHKRRIKAQGAEEEG